ncbi:UNVERIFIED_CONTAM: hypothetical protein FKN15_072743 [Acipenser sinensis]
MVSIAPVGFPRILITALRQIILIGLCIALLVLLYLFLDLGRSKQGWLHKDKKFQRYLARVTDVEATDTSNPYLNYGIVVDCGSSGSRVFVYCWPRHNGNPHDLLDIKQMRDKNRKPVVMKIKPGISELAITPEKASDYIYTLLSFASQHIPKVKHKETPLYILCTAGMRILPESQQEALLEDLRTDIPVHFDFLFSDSHVEVISGKQEDDAVVEVQVPGSENQEAVIRKRTAGVLDMGGVSTQIAYEVPKTYFKAEAQLMQESIVFQFFGRCSFQKLGTISVYAWIGINFVLGRFDHIEDDDAVVEVQVPGSENQEAVIRKRTAGVLDMGGVSTQIAYEVPKTEEVAKNLLAEFNLGCDAHRTEHVYRVYVTTFLGFGGNAARQRYEESTVAKTELENRLLGKHTGETPESPYLDPCLPLDIVDEIQHNGKTLLLRGTGDFDRCRVLIQPFMNKTNETQSSLNGVYQPPIDYQNSEFYGFSEFYYCTEDVLRMGGNYNSYCATKWTTLKERFDRGLYASHADLHRLKYQCFKSAWMHEVFHVGFSFPENYRNLKTALLVYDKEVQWTLGAILYRTRFLPLRDIQQENFKANHYHWRGFSFVYNHYLFLVCFLVVLLSILLYLLRLRRIHHRMPRSTSSSALWMEEGGAALKIPGTP